MSDLHRHLAPISEAAWSEIDEEASNTLKRMLAARRLVDFEGPLGWQTSALGLGRTELLAEPPEELAEARLRLAQPLLEIRVPFELDRSELESIGRGAKDADLDPVVNAARIAARAEDRAVFHGYAPGAITGVFPSAEETLALTTDYTKYAGVVADAINRLRVRGVDGPYAIALGPQCYTGLTRTTENGYPVLEHVRALLDGPLVWAPAVDGAVVLSLRGGDFELSVGRDFSIGYLDHTATTVRLYLEESFTLRVLTPEAAVPLVYE